MATSLTRFTEAQANSYADALQEVKAGRKRTHWMWFIFPQIAGLGRSSTSRYYAIKSLNEAAEYLAHPELGARLIEISNALLQSNSKNAGEIFGYPDDMKLHSSITLFAQVDNAPQVFQKVLDKYFGSELDDLTLQLLRQ